MNENSCNRIWPSQKIIVPLWTFINDCYHMTKVTIVKNYRNTVTLRQVDLPERVEINQEQAYEELCRHLREI